METESQGQIAHQVLSAPPHRHRHHLPAPGIPGLDVVRALHQTVVSLRSALDLSREEIRVLKSQKQPESAVAVTSDEHTRDRRQIASTIGRRPRKSDVIANSGRTTTNPLTTNPAAHTCNQNEATHEVLITIRSSSKPRIMSDSEVNTIDISCPESESDAKPPDPQGTDEVDQPKPSESCEGGIAEEQIEPAQEPIKLESTPLSDIAEVSESGAQSKISLETESKSEEVDEIELIFTTTDEPLRDVGLQEDFVSITADNEPGRPAGTSSLCNGNKNSSSVDEAVSSQSSSIDREESVDRFDEGSSSARLNKLWSQCSVLVETDISKCGVLEEGNDKSTWQTARRNTLAAPVQTYRPIIHREALSAGRRKSLGTPLRPVADVNTGSRKESAAQTDISALPAQWRSESYLAHKVAHSFTTLPSKFALPAGMPGRLRLSEKTRETRRVMLSDYSFTSMVPELSRSADHLCQENHPQNCYNSRGGCSLRTPEAQRRECWARGGTSSPCDCRMSTELCPGSTTSTRCRCSMNSIPSPGIEVQVPCRRATWRPMTGSSLDTWRAPTKSRPLCSSVPCSPTRLPTQSGHKITKRTRSKVTFQECPMIRGSLPNLRSDMLVDSTSGESTESLVDEAEDYLRKSIDSMLTMGATVEYYSSKQTARKRRSRRHSEPDLFKEWVPPQDARPYLPKVPRDLKLDHLVKVISPEGRILQGKVRYIGPLSGREEIHVGIELPNSNGNSDGTFNGTRFFNCQKDRAIFISFKKVILAWATI